MKSSVENKLGSLDLLRIMSENSCGRVDKQRPEADLSRVSIEAATVHPFSLLSCSDGRSRLPPAAPGLGPPRCANLPLTRLLRARAASPPASGRSAVPPIVPSTLTRISHQR